MSHLHDDLQQSRDGCDEEDQRQIATDFFQQGAHLGSRQLHFARHHRSRAVRSILPQAAYKLELAGSIVPSASTRPRLFYAYTAYSSAFAELRAKLGRNLGQIIVER